MLHQILVAGMTDADAHAAILVADMRADRAQSVVAGDAAADFDPHLAGRQFDFVVEHRDVAGRHFVELRRLGDGAARLVHESPRQEQQHPFAVDWSLAGDTLKAPAPRPDAVALRDFLDRHEANVVAVADVARSRIS